MSRLDELIAEYCPDGVEYKTLGELGKFFGGLTGKGKDDFKDGNAAFITYRNVYANPALDIYPMDKVRIFPGEKQRTLKYGDVIFTGSSETPDECGFSSVVTKEPEEPLYLNSFCFFFRFDNLSVVNPDFAKHLFRSENLRYQIGKTASGVTRFNVSKDKMAKVRIPLPPLPVQREIVRILDNFTELTARKKQYEYYRDGILSFKDENVEWHTIGEIFEVRNGYTPSKKVPEYWKNGTVPWFRLEDIRANGRKLFDAIQHVHFSGIKKSGLFKKNSIMISTTATLGEHALICTDYLSNQQLTNLTVNDAYRDKLLPEFAFYYCFVIDKLCESVANYSGGIPIVDQNKFKALLFPIPSIERQIQIVSLLDRFDNFCNDMQSGLPAEIEARQKQYEYYRDKLLTFKENVPHG